MLVTRSRCSCRRAAALAALPCLLLLAVTPARQAAGQPAADEGSVSGGEMLVQVMIELTDEEAAVPAEEGSSASGEDEKGGGESAGARRAAGTFEDHVGSGLQLYQAGSYAAALAEFQAAYQLVPEVNLLYNIARCFEKLGRKERAIAS
ncbi:MAG: hypothetical protein FJ125_03540, partial [Deltaproteobacteria bacterium]|nr:hypothetical protein [Deltaproteobacteria bacterium]